MTMSPRFNRVEYNLVLSKASFLRIINDVEALTVTHDKEVGCDTAEDDAAIPVEKSLIWHDFDGRASSSKVTPKSSALVEFRQYTEEPLKQIYRRKVSEKENPLVWWEARKKIYLRSPKLARKPLAVIATSVPSERVFSKAGQIISERRSRLKSSTI
ncbi:hypothetical protein J437_LFUL016842 [Ladona fulva]|uniref:HAT C-terminal dimerisation domain-containing protein n=1 Tax=Ladona fulva TaxID=123851 RepID=A0A8K0KMK2_LADFU|nr:hypothetical protein J437_LFUL016842 [Ladona fulva]